MTRKDVVEKIIKLLSLSSSDNINEATLAAQKAKKLMVKYEISESDLSKDINSEILEETFNLKTKTIPSYFKILMSAICEYCDCRAIMKLKEGGKQFVIVGRDSDTQIAKHLFIYMRRFVEKQVEKIKTNFRCDFSRSELFQFRNGVRYGIAIKLHDLKEKEKKISHENETALILCKSSAVDSYLSQFKIDKEKPPGFNPNSVSNMGIDVGYRINVNKSVEASNENDQIKEGK